jgi:hypothetical protein
MICLFLWKIFGDISEFIDGFSNICYGFLLGILRRKQCGYEGK